LGDCRLVESLGADAGGRQDQGNEGEHMSGVILVASYHGSAPSVYSL
jgi:hypothetical protein